MDDNFDPSNPSHGSYLMNFLNEQEMYFPTFENQQYFLTNTTVQSVFVENEHEMHLPASINQQATSISANRGFNISSREPSLSTEGNPSLRGSLSQRIARAGFSAPTINTYQINTENMASTMDIQSSYLTISPGHTPSAFFDSPVLISNASAQLSPTTGIISLPHYGHSSLPISTLDSTIVEKRKVENLEEIMPSGVSFHPPPDATPSYRSSMENKISSPTDNNEENIQNNINEPSCIKDHVKHISVNDSSHLETEFDGEDDGFKWGIYGQKPVKGSEYSRSYYKCTHPSCPVKKKVERSHEGYITKVIYKGIHHHETPAEKSRSGIPPYRRCYIRIDASLVEFEEQSNSAQNQNAVIISSSNSAEELEDGETHASIGNEGDGEGDDNESNRRSLDASAAEMNIGAGGTREPRIVLQTESEVDILDDGYWWRKYGQKVVKGNPNPRSYYRCTSAGCTVRKHIERAWNDLTTVITTYKGKHNHEVPPARSSINHSTAAYHSHTLKRRHPKLPQKPLMNINPPPILDNLNLPNLDYWVRPTQPFDMDNIGIGIWGGMGQMGHQIRYPVLDSNIGADGLMLPKEDDTAMEAYDQLMTTHFPLLGPLGPPICEYDTV